MLEPRRTVVELGLNVPGSMSLQREGDGPQPIALFGISFATTVFDQTRPIPRFPFVNIHDGDLHVEFAAS